MIWNFWLIYRDDSGYQNPNIARRRVRSRGFRASPNRGAAPPPAPEEAADSPLADPGISELVEDVRGGPRN